MTTDEATRSETPPVPADPRGSTPRRRPTPSARPLPATDTPRPARRSAGLLVGSVVAMVVIAAATAGFIALREEPNPDLEIVIPAGTGVALDAGDDPALLADQVELEVGDTVGIVNDDSRFHQVGAIAARPGEETEYTFTEPGRFLVSSTVHPSGEVTFLVVE